jgi:hypothetical protein
LLVQINWLCGNIVNTATGPAWFNYIYTFTCQSNWMVLIYLVALITTMFFDVNKKFYNFVRSRTLLTSVTVYISITFLVVVVLLDKIYNGTWSFVSGGATFYHGLSTIAMWLVFFFVPAADSKYTAWSLSVWKRVGITVIYPLAYVALTAVVGGFVKITNKGVQQWAFPYDFLNYKDGGIGVYIAYVLGLLVVFSFFSWGLYLFKQKIDKSYHGVK